MHTCSRARGLLFLTRQEFFPFSIFSPYFSGPGPHGAVSQRGQVPGWAPVQHSQHSQRGLDLSLGLGAWPWAGRRALLVKQDTTRPVTNIHARGRWGYSQTGLAPA